MASQIKSQIELLIYFNCQLQLSMNISIAQTPSLSKFYICCVEISAIKLNTGVKPKPELSPLLARSYRLSVSLRTNNYKIAWPNDNIIQALASKWVVYNKPIESFLEMLHLDFPRSEESFLFIRFFH